MPLFSVVIPTFNRRDLVLRAVRSAMVQRFRDHEIIVVDDGSSDGTVEALRQLGGGVRTLRQQNLGPAAARTAGARAARGTYVVFLDSDDRWFPWTLAAFDAALKAHPGATWLYGGGTLEGSADAITEQDVVTTHFDGYSAAAAALGLMPLPSGVAISREVFLAHEGFRPTMRVAEDLDLWFRIAGEHGFVLIDAPPTYVRAVGRGSLGENLAHAHRGMMDLLRRERQGAYGTAREPAFVRRAIVSRQLMYYADACRRRGRGRLAARLYLEVLRSQACSRFREAPFGGRRNRFLLTFPLALASPSLHRRLKRVLAPRSSRGGPVVHDRG
jgi:glycosyltransferase involved in cell wall biosynthesis